MGKGDRSLMNVHGPELGAPRQGGDGLAGVEQARRIKRRLDRGEGFDLGCAKLGAHLVDLFAPDAVLAGDRAADGDAQLQDRPAQDFGPLHLAVDAGVIEDQGVQIAVAGVKYVGDR